MTYELSLKVVALVLAAGLAGAGLFGLARPGAVRAWTLGAARNFGLGLVLMAAAALWTVLLLVFMDLGEYTSMRQGMIAGVLVLAAATVLYLPEYLAPRAAGVLLLLGAEVLLSAAFPVMHPARYVITVHAYAWAVAGMWWVAAPHAFRNLCEWAAASDARVRTVSWVRLGYGALVAVLALRFYP